MATASIAFTVNRGPPMTKSDELAIKIECPVCCEIYKTPKCLACGHSVCEGCCQRLLQSPSSSIPCPVCRQATVVPAGGLPTNFGMQDLIQYYQNVENQRKYRCAKCTRACTADEAMIDSTKTGVDMVPYCFRCIIGKHAAGDSAAPPVKAMELITVTFKRYETSLSNLKSQVDKASAEQTEWINEAKQVAKEIEERKEAMVQASQTWITATMDDVEKLNNDLRNISDLTKLANVPQSLEALEPFEQSMQDTSIKLGQLIKARCRTIQRANVVLNSLAIGLDCLLNADDDLEGKDGNAVAGTDNGGGDWFCGPSFEKEATPGAVASSASQSDSRSNNGLTLVLHSPWDSPVRKRGRGRGRGGHF